MAPSRAAQPLLVVQGEECVRQAVWKGVRVECCDALWVAKHTTQAVSCCESPGIEDTTQAQWTPGTATFLFWTVFGGTVPGSDGLCTGTPSSLIPSSISPSHSHPALVLGLSLCVLPVNTYA